MFKIYIIDLIDFSSFKGIIEYFVNNIFGKDWVSVYKFMEVFLDLILKLIGMLYKRKNNLGMRVNYKYLCFVWLNIFDGKFFI